MMEVWGMGWEKDPKDRSKWMPKKVMLAKYADDAWREFVGWHKPCWLRSDGCVSLMG